jgi:hypothetical protein
MSAAEHLTRLRIWNERLRVRDIRRDHPGWTWEPIKSGMQWYYVGTRGDEFVRVYSAAHVTGDSDDDLSVRWMVDVYEDRRVATCGESYWMWSIRHPREREPLKERTGCDV